MLRRGKQPPGPTVSAYALARKQSLHLRFVPLVLASILLLWNFSFTELFLSSPVGKRGQLFNQNRIAKSDDLWVGEIGCTIAHVPARQNRFEYPWALPRRVAMLSLAESRNRVLYSSLRESASDGIGHAFGIMNAEVGAALRFGLTYTHRHATYGSLTEFSPEAVEDFFGWGVGHISRTSFRETFCNSSYDGHPMFCQPCDVPKSNPSRTRIRFQNVVELNLNLTYKRPACRLMGIASSESYCRRAEQLFIKEHNESNTIFQMPLQTCDQSPVDAFIDRDSRSYFFHKYWDVHGSTRYKENEPPGDHHATEEHQKVLQHYGRARKRESIRFSEAALVIAIHARRGDFFDVGRPMISCESFALVVRQVVRVVQAHGGIFGTVPVSVHIYSEGKPTGERKSAGHNINFMDREFYDANGMKRNASWISNLIRRHSEGKKEGGVPDLFRRGLDVHLHISSDTMHSLHEMISADIFIGSDSAMGKFIVSSLSRGALQLIPRYDSQFESGCCFTPFNPSTGILGSPLQIKRVWGEYAKANEASLRRAYYYERVFGRESNTLTSLRKKPE